MKSVLGLLALTILSGVSAWAATPCPAVQNDTNGCEFIITVTAVNGAGAATAFTVAVNAPDQGPYDGCDDTLVGIVNNSGATLKSITLADTASPEAQFDFDGDGACAALGGACVNGAGDTSGYGGPGVNFSNIVDDVTGQVNFGCTGVGTCAGIANSATAWFSLEGVLTASAIGPTTPTPIPSSVLLTSAGLALLGLFYFARNKFAASL